LIAGGKRFPQNMLKEVVIMAETKREQPQLPDGWSELRKAKASANTAWAYYRDLVKLLHKEIGEEKTAGILSKLMAANARKYVRPSMEMFGIKGNDTWALASYFKLATGDIIGYKAELIQEGPKKVVYRLYPPCLWFPDLDIPASFCMAEGNFEAEAARIVNPKIKTSMRSLMTRGEPCCDTVFEEVD